MNPYEQAAWLFPITLVLAACGPTDDASLSRADEVDTNHLSARTLNTDRVELDLEEQLIELRFDGTPEVAVFVALENLPSGEVIPPTCTGLLDRSHTLELDTCGSYISYQELVHECEDCWSIGGVVEEALFGERQEWDHTTGTLTVVRDEATGRVDVAIDATMAPGPALFGDNSAAGTFTLEGTVRIHD